ncbi:hypothetical protein TNIN_28731 [Trichonephila inaurata madagascariensis]|uniref:Uncharacterized protein n=1 Tax=Trichonephila inaurata madagascariensis TaxID=2747483 RepID=A0A8X6XRT7_9ARAC|nr:hypothetical protein TNIN_28731 [Trichonephila inaurata madagascariensis]
MLIVNDENDASQQANNVPLQRPEFYPCPHCHNMFTERALEVHKKSCSEDEKCNCTVCKLTKNNCLLTTQSLFRQEDEQGKNVRLPFTSVSSNLDSSAKKDTEESLEESPVRKQKTL